MVTPLVYRLKDSSGQIVFGIVWAVLFSGLAVVVYSVTGDPWGAIIPGFAAGIGLLSTCGSIKNLTDRSPKLTISETEIIDGRAAAGGETRYRWTDIVSMDCQMSGGWGKLIVYLRDGAGVKTREIDLNGLDETAEKIFIEIKKFVLTQPGGPVG
jgi:hypothetical protein